MTAIARDGLCMACCAAMLAGVGCGDDAGGGVDAGAAGAGKTDGVPSTSGGSSAASATIGAKGGKITLDDGTEVDVPANALSDDTEIEIAATDAEPPSSLGDVTAVSKVYEFLPDGLAFDKPIEVTMPYEGDSDTLAAFSEAANGTVDDHKVVSADGEKAVVAVDHFSRKFLTGCFAGKTMCFSHKGVRGVRAMKCTRPITWEDIETCGENEICEAGACVCKERCGDRKCGDDACGNSCGDCQGGATCEAGECVACQPRCADKECGDDGCGGSCGTCPGDAKCAKGKCGATSNVGCTPPHDLSGTWTERYNCVQHDGDGDHCWDCHAESTFTVVRNPEVPGEFTFTSDGVSFTVVFCEQDMSWGPVERGPVDSRYTESGLWTFGDADTWSGTSSYCFNADASHCGDCTSAGKRSPGTPADPAAVGVCPADPSSCP